MSSKAEGKRDRAPPAAVPTTDTANKPKTAIEDVYQKRTQLEHILLRPDTFIGSIQPVKESKWVYEEDRMVQRSIKYVPGLYKIFDEILVNAADHKQRDPKMDTIKIEIDQENNQISVWNNGTGIPIVEHKEEKMYVPTMIFGHLLTSSNFSDNEKKVVGGRNGYGAKLCNVFSTRFTVETANKDCKLKFEQTWENNMSKASEPKITNYNGQDYTKITFRPDLTKFNMKSLDDGIVALLSRRAFDIAGTSRLKVFLNGLRLPVKNFKEYVDLYVKDILDEDGNPVKVIHEVCGERWEIAVCPSEFTFKQISFVNSVATTKGGRHVDDVVELLVEQLVEITNKKNNPDKSGITIEYTDVEKHIFVFINCLIENPTFDSQTKEFMTLEANSFGSWCYLTDKFYYSLTKSDIVKKVLRWAKFQADILLEKTGSGSKANILRGFPKLEDANDAGTNKSLDCTLILTEGDSAKSLAVAGLGVIGRDKYGVYPLRGKMLNVREASTKQIMENAEVKAVVKILGLKYKQKYETVKDMKSLRYGRLMIMTDQDHDGSHIKGLIINFIHHNWPSLLRMKFLEEFITPIVKVTKGNESIPFFSLPELEEWKKTKPNWKSYRVKYYKGLGTSTSKEAKEYFTDMARHRILFQYSGRRDDEQITMAFSKKCVEQRKNWLTTWMEDFQRRKELRLAEEIIYNSNVKAISYSDFINKELVLFSNSDNERSIPSLVDGLKPGQRKVLYTCFKRNDKKDVKVAQLAGSVAEQSSYHHGEASLMSTIVNLAQNFVGSNNINLLLPIGQFGTRLHGGKDSASPRYIFTMLSPLARQIFHPHDDPILRNLYDDSQKIEPEWYCPIIPMVLVNGADGIGTGWMTKIPNFNPREVVANLRRMIRGNQPEHMQPWYKNFRGEIIEISRLKYAVNGEVSLVQKDSIAITELPIGTWTQTYKESVVDPMLTGKDKVVPVLTDYKEYHTDTSVKFVLSMKEDQRKEFELRGLHSVFKLQSVISLTSMVLFDKNGCLKRYESALDILKEFFELRMVMYQKRMKYLMGVLTAEAAKLTNQARFIVQKCEGSLTVENKTKERMIDELVALKYNSDPVKAWKDALATQQTEENDEGQEDNGLGPEGGRDYDYLLGMSMWSLTQERKEELLKQRDAKLEELSSLKKKTISDLYNEDLDRFLKVLDKVEKEEAEEETIAQKEMLAKKGLRKSTVATLASSQKIQPKLDDIIRRVEAGTKAKESKETRTALKKEGHPGVVRDETDRILKVAEDLGKLKISAKEKVLPKKKTTAKKAGAGKKAETPDIITIGSSDSDSEPRKDKRKVMDSVEQGQGQNVEALSSKSNSADRKIAPIHVSSGSASDNSPAEPSKKRAVAPKLKKPTTSKRKSMSIPKKATKKALPKNSKSKAVQVVSLDSDSDDGSTQMSTKEATKMKGKKGRKVNSSDEDFEPSTLGPVSPVTTEGTGRSTRRAAAAAASKYLVDDEEKLSDSD